MTDRRDRRASRRGSGLKKKPTGQDRPTAAPGTSWTRRRFPRANLEKRFERLYNGSNARVSSAISTRGGGGARAAATVQVTISPPPGRDCRGDRTPLANRQSFRKDTGGGGAAAAAAARRRRLCMRSGASATLETTGQACARFQAREEGARERRALFYLDCFRIDLGLPEARARTAFPISRCSGVRSMCGQLVSTILHMTENAYYGVRAVEYE